MRFGGLAVEEPTGVVYLDRVREDVDLHCLSAPVVGVREPVYDCLANRGHRELGHLFSFDARPLDDDPPADVRQHVELRFAGEVEERPFDLLDIEDVDPVAGAEHAHLQHGRSGSAEEDRGGVGQLAIRCKKAEALQGVFDAIVAEAYPAAFVAARDVVYEDRFLDVAHRPLRGPAIPGFRLRLGIESHCANLGGAHEEILVRHPDSEPAVA